MKHTLLIAPPGTGKITWARAQVGTLSHEDSPHHTYACQVAGMQPPPNYAAPLRAPHHTASRAAIKGSLQKGYQWRPGEMSLAYGGVLLLDEAPEFHRDILETVADAITQGSITYVSANNRLHVPVRFQLILAMNPCPCGWRGSAHRPCTCKDEQVQRYIGRVRPLVEALGCQVLTSDKPHEFHPAQLPA